MHNEKDKKIAESICEQLILYSQKKHKKKKKLIELFQELLEEKDKNQQYLILSYIPECLAEKGYEIVNSDYFELKKY